eukprot:5017369-Amphidinium_carterae.1
MDEHLRSIRELGVHHARPRSHLLVRQRSRASCPKQKSENAKLQTNLQTLISAKGQSVEEDIVAKPPRMRQTRKPPKFEKVSEKVQEMSKDVPLSPAL